MEAFRLTLPLSPPLTLTLTPTLTLTLTSFGGCHSLDPTFQARSFGGPASEAPADLKIGLSGGLLLTGTTTGSFAMGPHVITGMGSLVSWVSMLDAEGRVLAAKVS